MFRHPRSNELEFKRLPRYSKHTQYCGIVLDPNSDTFKLATFPDADFAGMHEHKKPDDPACAKSRTGFIITSAKCTFLCISILQTETNYSTMDSDTIALAHCC